MLSNLLTKQVSDSLDKSNLKLSRQEAQRDSSGIQKASADSCWTITKITQDNTDIGSSKLGIGTDSYLGIDTNSRKNLGVPHILHTCLSWCQGPISKAFCWINAILLRTSRTLELATLFFHELHHLIFEISYYWCKQLRNLENNHKMIWSKELKTSNMNILGIGTDFHLGIGTYSQLLLPTSAEMAPIVLEESNSNIMAKRYCMRDFKPPIFINRRVSLIF